MKKNLFYKNRANLKQQIRLSGFSFFNKIVLSDRSLASNVRVKLLFVLLAQAHCSFRFLNSTHFRTQCLLTWRTGSFYSFFRLTRLTLRERFSFGLIKGVRKSSW
jgi:ribosomal protein S14